jgi:hypothetical protein
MSVATRTLIIMIINCDTCTMRDLACDDCVVSVIISVTEREVITPKAIRAINTLAESGIVPPLRFHA